MNTSKKKSQKIINRILLLTAIISITGAAEIPDRPHIPPLLTNNQYLKDFIEKIHKSFPKRFKNTLNETYQKHCSTISPEELEYSDEEINTGHLNLMNHMEWARVASDMNTAQYFSDSKDTFKILLILSNMGKFVVLLSQLSVCITVLGVFFTILFFCFPPSMQMIYAWLTNDKEEYNLQGKPFHSYPYYKDIKNWMTRKRISPFGLFGMRFVSSGVVCFCLIIASFQIMRVDTSNDCGLLKASLDLIQGKNGTLFSEFGLLSNKSLLYDFKIDLEDYKRRPFEANYQKLLDKDFEKLGEDVEISMNSYYKKMTELDVRSCKNDIRIKPIFAHDVHYGINDELYDEVRKVVKIGNDIADAAEYLKALQIEKDEKMKKFNDTVTFISSTVDIIAEDILYITHRATKYLKSYDDLLNVLAIIALVTTLYIFLQLLPTNVLGNLRFPKTVQLSIQFIMATLMFLLGGYLFIETQTMIQGCLTANQILDDPASMKNFLGANQDSWIEVCLANSGTGDLEDLIPREKKSEFFHGFNVLRGFSVNLTALKNEMPNYKLKEAAEYERKIDMLANHHENLLKNHGEDSYPNAVANLNEKIKCTQLEFGLTTEGCRANYDNNEILVKWPEGVDPSKEGEDFSKFPKKRLCIVLPKLEPPMSLTAFEKIMAQHECIKEDKKRVMNINFDNLSKCLDSHQDFMTVVKDHFQMTLGRIIELNKNLISISHVHGYIRDDFRESLVKYERENKKIEDMLNCKSLRDSAKMMLGNFCYSSKGLRHGLDTAQSVQNNSNKRFGFGAWFWFFISGYGLILISLSNFLEGLIDKTVLRKYRELSGRSEDTRVGFESELGPI